MKPDPNPQNNSPTVNYYNNSAEAWASSRDTPNYWSNQMSIFHKHLSSGKVLEIGLGTGRDAEELIKLGYSYTGIEPSLGMLALALKRKLKGFFMPIGVESLNFENLFEGFWAAASLLHIEKSQIESDLQRIYRSLKPGGVGTIIIKKYIEGSGPDERVEKDEGGERFFAYYRKDDSVDEFAEILVRNNFELIEEVVVDERNPKSTFLIYTVRKVKEP